MNSQNIARVPLGLRTRGGASWMGVLGVLAIISVVVVGVGWMFTSENVWSDREDNRIVHSVVRGTFTHVIAVKGEIESSSNVDVRCLVKSRNTSGTAILWIIPEGTYVNKGDKLVELDSSALESELTTQQILVNNSGALVIQAQSVYEIALVAEKEYIEGTFIQELKTIAGEIYDAEENLRRAEQFLLYSRILFAKDFYTQLQLKADEFAVEQAANALDLAKSKLLVLETFTKDKMVIQFRADIQTAKARLDSEEKSHSLDIKNLEDIEEQLRHCVIHAESPGQVVYASESDYRGRDDVIIEEGVMVRERQMIIRLPNPREMQVKSKVNEAHVKLVEAGLPATILIDAFPDLKLTGTVTKVNEMPEAGGWRRGNVREYATFVRIDDPPPGLRPGMNSSVNIRVEQLPNELQVPVQAVVEHGGKYYCLMKNGHGLEAREVLLGSSNENFLVVRDGLVPDEEVLMNPRAYLSEVDLPQIERAPDVAEGGQADPQPTDVAQSDPPGLDDADRPEDRGPRRQRGGPEGGNPTQIASAMIQRMDRDSDGKLSRDEIPQRMRDNFDQNDVNGDGFLDTEELMKVVSAFRSPSLGTGGGAGQ